MVRSNLVAILQNEDLIKKMQESRKSNFSSKVSQDSLNAEPNIASPKTKSSLQISKKVQQNPDIFVPEIDKISVKNSISSIKRKKVFDTLTKG